MKKLYSPSTARKLTEAAARKAYSELRSIANKRIDRTWKSGLTFEYQPHFPTLKQLDSMKYGNVFSALADVSAFVRSERTTVKGLRKFYKDMREAMTEQGYGDLVETDADVWNMIKYMDYLREQYSEKLFDSGDALDVLEQGQRLNIPIDKLSENYDLFASNLDKMEKLRRSPGGKEFSQARIDKLIKKWS